MLQTTQSIISDGSLLHLFRFLIVSYLNTQLKSSLRKQFTPRYLNLKHTTEIQDTEIQDTEIQCFFAKE